MLIGANNGKKKGQGIYRSVDSPDRVKFIAKIGMKAYTQSSRHLFSGLFGPDKSNYLTLSYKYNAGIQPEENISQVSVFIAKQVKSLLTHNSRLRSDIVKNRVLFRRPKRVMKKLRFTKVSFYSTQTHLNYYLVPQLLP